jgi:hypothetical protein
MSHCIPLTRPVHPPPPNPPPLGCLYVMRKINVMPLSLCCRPPPRPQALVAEGKVKYVGISEAGPDDIRAAHGVCPLSAVQLEWSLWSRWGGDSGGVVLHCFCSALCCRTSSCEFALQAVHWGTYASRLMCRPVVLVPVASSIVLLPSPCVPLLTQQVVDWRRQYGAHLTSSRRQCPFACVCAINSSSHCKLF